MKTSLSNFTPTVNTFVNHSNDNNTGTIDYSGAKIRALRGIAGGGEYAAQNSLDHVNCKGSPILVIN